MSTNATSIPTIPDSIVSQLNRMRRKMTNWVIVHGLGRWLLIILAVAAIDILLDRFFKMDFAQRAIMLVTMLVIAALFFFWRLIRPLMNRPTDDALIYKVEDQHPELEECLISSYQLAREQDLLASGVSRELAAATINRGIEQSRQLDFGKALDGTGNVVNWLRLLAGLILVGLLSYGVVHTDFLRTWFNRNILLGSDQWPQATYLEIVGQTDGRLIYPRGTDQRQLVRVSDTSRIRDVDVSLEVEGPFGTTIHSMKPTGKLDGREHVFVFHNVSSQFRFRARGGDDTTSWVQVDLVEPPSIEDLQITARLPAYTGIDALPLVGSGPHSVLDGSRLDVRIRSNKPLSTCRLVRGDLFYDLNPQDDDQLLFQVQIPETGTLAGAAEDAERDAGAANRLVGGEYEFELVDTTGLSSNRPAQFAITIKEDEPPKVRADLLGISGLVVPRARLPVSYNAMDQYGLSRLQFECQWRGAAADETGDAAGLNKRVVDFPPLQAADGAPVRQVQDVNVLDVEPLELAAGTSLRLTVNAIDTCPRPPGIGRSQEFLLRIVTEEELRADLLRREIEQRKAFEQAYNAQMELSAELQAVAAMKPERQSQDKFDADRETRLIALNRDQKLVGTSVDRIANRFEEFLVEVKNNRLDEEENEQVPEQTIERRFDQRIIQPIRELDATLIALATRHLDDCRRNVRDPAELAASVQETVAIQQQIIEAMKIILDSMVDAENFQEAVNKLLEIKRLEERLRGEIKKRNQPDNIFEGDDNEDIFDDDQ